MQRLFECTNGGLHAYVRHDRAYPPSVTYMGGFKWKVAPPFRYSTGSFVKEGKSATPGVTPLPAFYPLSETPHLTMKV